MADKMRPEGFYRIRMEGQPGVAYCQQGNVGDGQYETWTTVHLFDRFDGKPHPAHTTMTSRDPRFRKLEIGKRIKL